jgi:GntR family transcriptional regulator
VVIDHGGERWEYLQLADILRERIADGTYRPGDKIPPLLDLQTEFSLSSMTVRRAVGVLSGEGLLVRVPGRGTFVARTAG